MKKAKRLLAMILTVVMVMSAASVSTYGVYTAYDTPQTNSVEGYVFNKYQGASYVLDLLDGILADANLDLTWESLGISNAAKNAINLIVSPDLPSSINLSSIDNATVTLQNLINCVDDGFVNGLSSLFDILGDIIDLEKEPLNPGLLRTTMGVTDMDVLMMYIGFLYNNRDHLASIVAGTFGFGALDGSIPAMLKDLDGFLKDTLYSLLLNGDATTSTGTTDNAVQQLVNWALIEGTGDMPATGSESLLGANFEPLLPSLANYGTVTANAMGTGIGSGTYYQAASLKNISFYQLVNNVINAALGSLVVPLLTDLLCGVFNVEITEEFPGGDPALLNDPILVMVLGLVETLATDNGAEPPDYTEEDNATPLAKITAVLNWFILDGGMDNFILFDDSGLHITDAFMSLLGDLIRLVVNMFDDFGLDQVNGGYTAEELNENYYYNSLNELVPRSQGGEQIGVSYITFETEEKVVIPAEVGAMVSSEGKYVLYLDEATNEYRFLGTNVPVSDYPAINVDLIRQNRVVTVSELFAYAISVVLNSFVPGCYFPEEAKSIAEVGAYALAAQTAKILPDMNFLEQLDANYKSSCIASGGTWDDATGTGTYLDSSGNVVKPLIFVEHERITANGFTFDYYIPTAVLKIAACLGAFYLNGILEADFTVDTTAETFFEELIVWGAERYLPILTGQRQGSGSTVTYSGGVFAAAFQSFARGSMNFYQLLDSTIFRLIPSSWLPTKYASAPSSKGTAYTLIYEWLFGSLRTLDLQKLLGIMSVNTNADAELQQPVLTVILRLVDRVLALVMNGNALLPPYDRNSITAVYNTNTTITSLDTLLTGGAASDPLPSLVKYLLQYLYTSAGITGSNDTIAAVLLGTLFPLLLSTDYQKPYRAEILGTSPTITIDDLKIYVEEVNHYNDIAEEIDGVITYTAKDFLTESTTATYSEASGYGITQYSTQNPEGVIAGRDVYSGFTNATYVPATATTKRGSYNGNYVFFEAEDYGTVLYRFNNSSATDKDGEDFVGSYERFYKDTLPGYYGEWSRYFINRRLYAAGLYDSNADGVVDTNDVAPGVPGVAYPYYNSASSAINYKDGVVNKSFNVNSLTAANYETISLALENAALAETRVTLNTGDANAIVRLALNLAPSAFTAADFSTLTATQIATLTDFCNSIGYTYDTSGAEPCITRPAFAIIGSATTTGASVSAAPPTTKPTDDAVTDYDLSRAIYDGIVDYYTALEEMKQGLFNIYDEMNYRRELAEAGVRNSLADTTQLDWALRKFEPHYYTGVRNANGTVDKLYGRNVSAPQYVQGQMVYSKVYTAASYAAFQQAYDFAVDLSAVARTQQGIPQSLVTKARAMLLNAYNHLIPYTGRADYELLEQYVTRAQEIIATTQLPTYNAEVGFEETSLANLQAVLTDASILLQQAMSDAIDCESNDIIAANAMSLISAIESLEFKAAADIIEKTGGYKVIKDLELSDPTNQRGYIYDLKEGEGLTDTGKVELIGLLLDPDRGNVVEIRPAAASGGAGTGSYIRGARGNSQVFRYYAILFGDVNGDTRIDGTDKTAVQFEMINNGINANLALTAEQKLAADTNRDGAIDADDVVLIQARVDQPTNMNVINQSSTVTG